MLKDSEQKGNESKDNEQKNNEQKDNLKDTLKANLLAFGLGIAGLTVVIDQVTKHLITHTIPFASIKPLIPSLALTLRYNTGAGFSFLADAGGWQRWFFVILALIISTCIVFWLKQVNRNQKLEGIGLALILGGAIGNLIDRLLYGKVIDFILLYYKQWEWPAFNVADSAICVGVVFLVAGIGVKSPK